MEIASLVCWLVATIAIVYTIVVFLYDVKDRLEEFGKEYNRIGLIKATPIENQLSTLDSLIEKEFNAHVVIPRIGRELKPPIDDITETTKYISKNIMDGLTPEFFSLFKANGISEEFILRHITRELFVKIIMYINESKKKPE